MIHLEVEIEKVEDLLLASGRGSRGERTAAQKFTPTDGLDGLQAFANKIGRAVRTGRSLDAPVLELAREMYEQLFDGELRDLLIRLLEAAQTEPLLVRFFLADRTLAGIPWEALCQPGMAEGFLGTDRHMVIARGVHSTQPWQAREIPGAVRVLVIAPGEAAETADALRQTLEPAMAIGEVEWLEPIVGSGISAKVLYDRLRRGDIPHILHFIGHGDVDAAGRPTLRLADDDEGEPIWMTAEGFARELGGYFAEDLRLVVLEACEGAKGGAFGSAAEILMKAGADAVVAHLWPVRANVARTCSTELYKVLTGSERRAGDIGQSMAAARSSLLVESAEAFSPVLYLRGSDSVLFDFQHRTITTPKSPPTDKSIPPTLAVLLAKQHSLILGDQDEERDVLRRELVAFMKDNDDKPDEGMHLSALTQRCMLRFGQDVLHSLFQQALVAAPTTQAPLLVEALGKHVPPGVHMTLLWRPHLERAIAEKQPDRTIWAIQPSFGGSALRPRVVKRAAGSTTWKMEPSLPKQFDLDHDIVILRMYGGYSAESRPIFSPPLLTEDDHIHGLLGADGLRPPQWMEQLLTRSRILPAIFINLSILDWRHRMLLWWLYDQRPAPKESLALLPEDADRREPEMWDTGGGLPGTGRIAAILENFDALAAKLANLDVLGGWS